MIALRLEQLAERVGGEILGDRSLVISGAAALDRAGPEEISFASDLAHLKGLKNSRAGACLIARKSRDEPALTGSQVPLVLVDDPLDSFISILTQFRPHRSRPALGVSPHAYINPGATIGAGTNVYPGAYIDDEAKIGSRCDIYPGVYIGRNCRIGDDCVLHAHVVLYPDVQIGHRSTVHAHAVIGADGFGYRFRNKRFEKIPQQGWVEVHEDCEIGAGATIDRGMIGATIVGEGTKLDNLVMVGHNCELGRHNVFASQVGLAGSVTTGDYVRCAGQVGVADHVHLGEGATLGAKSGVHKDIPAGETHVGIPARPEQEQFRIAMAAAKLPEMRRKLRDMETRLVELAGQVARLEQVNSEP
jgi:UDP-3-O-[3-hydroxymyristoyl] glucosamine N-acyltransferase